MSFGRIYTMMVLGALLTFLALGISFTELDIRGVELDEKGVLAVTSLMQSSNTLSLLNMAGCEIQNVRALACS